eukprot:symbB.v1.2.039972.t1/scaffold6909.1/size14659/1
MQNRCPAVKAPQPPPLLGKALAEQANTGQDNEHKNDDLETGSSKDNHDEEEEDPDPDLKTGKTKTANDDEKRGDEKMSPEEVREKEEVQVESKKPDEQVQKPAEEPAPSATTVPAMFKAPQVAAAKVSKPNPPPPPRVRKQEVTTVFGVC